MTVKEITELLQLVPEHYEVTVIGHGPSKEVEDLYYDSDDNTLFIGVEEILDPGCVPVGGAKS
jgi:hypothetical protein